MSLAEPETVSGGPTQAERELPLAGIRVLDIGTLIAGPMVATMLGDYGAEVIKIEKPGAGDGLRTWGYMKDGVPLYWQLVSRNKKSVTLDLRVAAGQEILKQLVRDADVLVESFRPGTLEKWNLAPEVLWEVNPRLVVLRMSGFGQVGPYSHRPGFGTLAESMSGFAHATGISDGPPTLPPFGLADNFAAMTGCWATMIALWARDTKGVGGQVVDVSLYETLLTALGPMVIDYDQLGRVLVRTGNRSPHISPRNAYESADGKWVAISTSSPSIIGRLAKMVGGEVLANDPRLATNDSRLEHQDDIDLLIEQWMKERTRDEILAAGEAAGVTIAPVYDVADIVADPHFVEAGSIVEVEHPRLGAVRMQNILARLSRTPGHIQAAAPDLGSHTDEVLRDLAGLSDAQIAALHRDGIS